MTTPTDEDMEDLKDTILHMENRVEKFRNLREVLNEYCISAQHQQKQAEVHLHAPPDTHKVTVIVTEGGEPSNAMLRLLDLQDTNNHIEYLPDGNRYRLKAIFWKNR